MVNLESNTRVRKPKPQCIIGTDIFKVFMFAFLSLGTILATRFYVI
jgi:hypothetical protein